MSPSEHHSREPARVRIPADVDRPDRIVAGLTTRQLGILASAGVGLWVAYTATAELLPLAAFAACAFPVAVAAVALALGRRDGVSLDRLVLAAVRQARAPRRRVPAPDGVPDAPGWVDADRGSLPAPLRLPARGIRSDGVIDLGASGAAVLLACSTLNFALRTTREQEALVAAFGRWLNSLTAPVQVVVRAERVDLGPTIARLREAAPGLPHPALETAAREHASFLTDLATRRDLLQRQVLLVVREPHPAPSGRERGSDVTVTRAARRGEEAVRALASAGVAARVLDGGQATATISAAADPASPPRPGGLAAPDAVITTREVPV